jgi:hypothetical protein
MTAQKQPLEVGVPLYPFSHTTLFRKDEIPRPSTEEASGAAPLPVSPPAPYEQHALSGHVPSTHTLSSNDAAMMAGTIWPQRDISASPATNNYV